MTKIKCVLDRVLVKPLTEEVTKGGIIIPNQAKEKPSVGEVVGVGPGKYDKFGTFKPTETKVGSKVLYKGKYAGVDMEPICGEKLLMMKEEDILGVVG